MCAAMKDMNADHSGTGVFYQAVPAVGADGKKMMRLIPVHIVNGQSFRQTKPILQKDARKNVTSVTTVTREKASLPQSSIQNVIRMHNTLGNSLPKQAGLNIHKSPDKHPQSPHTVNLLAKKSLVATPATHSEEPGSISSQFSVTVKSPALPKGHCLQIPSNAEVRTVPASELPAHIKNQILTSSLSSSSGLSVPNAGYVSPITAMSQGVNTPGESAPHSVKLPPKTMNKTSCPTKGSKTLLKLIQKFSQRPNSPIRWMIEEEENTVAPALGVLNSPSVTSEILSTVAKREKMSKQRGTIAKPVSESSQGQTGRGEENALLMCNGKVFFVAKKCKLPLSMERGNPPTIPTKTYELNKTVVPSSIKSPKSVSPEVRQQDHTIIISDEPDEVIDLCEDEAQDGTSQPAASGDVSEVPHQDEDNVIFVSYIPPKAESESAQEQETDKAHVEIAEQVGSSSSSSVTEQQSLNGTTGGDSTDETDRGRKTNGNIPDDTVKTPRVGGSAAMNVHENSEQSTSTQQFEVTEVRNSTHRLEISQNPAASCTSPLATKSCHMADHMLRQIFRITTDVKICLWRIDENESAYAGDSVKRLKAVTGEEPSDPHAHVGPLKYSHFQMKSELSAVKCHSGQNSLKGTSCDESESVIGYVEPIDEDFLNTDENDITDSCSAHTRPQASTCVDLNTSARRVGRARKRTICPCCVPGPQGPAKKSRTK